MHNAKNVCMNLMLGQNNNYVSILKETKKQTIVSTQTTLRTILYEASMLSGRVRERRGTFGKSTLLIAADCVSPVPVCEGCVHTSARGEGLQIDWSLSVLVDFSDKVVYTKGQCVWDDRRTTRRLDTTITFASRKTAALGDLYQRVVGDGSGPSTASRANRRAQPSSSSSTFEELQVRLT